MRRQIIGISFAITMTALTARSAPLGIMVPAYFSPSHAAYWNELDFAASRVPLVAIMNPDNGPGTSKSTGYVNVLSQLHQAGGKVTGYIYSSYGARALTNVEADIDRYLSWYDVDGFFVDEMADDANTTHYNYYQSIYQYIKSKGAQYSVTGNPGENTQQSYLSMPTVDCLMIFESNGSKYAGYSPASWVYQYPPEQFVHLPYGVTNITTMSNYVGLAVSRNAGWIYISDSTLYSVMPSYWTNEVNLVRSLNEASLLPAITDPAQPADQTATIGSSITFQVAASGQTPLSYQWFAGTNAISDATNSSYTIPSVQFTNAGSYYIQVGNSIGITNSRIALLTIITNASTYKNITIDGSFDDWAGVPLAYSQSQPTGDAVAFQNLYVANDANYLYIRFSLYNPANPFTSKQNIFFDTDTNAATGYGEPGFGSEILIQAGNGYRETNGVFNAGTINGLDWQASPAVPAGEFEVRVSRNATYADGAPVFPNNTIAIFLESGESSGNEWFPNVTGGLLYTFATSSVITNASTNALTVSLSSPTNNTFFNMSSDILLSATASDTGGSVTNVTFYQGTTVLAEVTAAPFTYIWTNIPVGYYVVTGVANDDAGAAGVSSPANITVASPILQQIKTVFMIPLENHDWIQKNPDGNPQQIFGNPAAPYVNSLVTPGNSNAAQVSYATHYYSVCMGSHPSEPNYVWSEAGTDFGIHVDNDPSALYGNIFKNVMHFSAQLTAAGIPWRSYAEDLEYSPRATTSVSGTGAVNPYNGTTEYYYAVKHNPMQFFTDTQNINVYPLTNFWTDLTNNNIGRYNWIEPNVYNEMHSALPSGFNYHGVQYTGNQAAIAEGDNCLSIIVPKIMASQAYKDHGVIIIWTDETESTDDTNTTLPFIVISPLAKGNAYASALPYSHSSTLKTLDEIFGLAFQTNTIPAADIDAQNTGYNYVNGSSAVVNDLSDLFQIGPIITSQPASVTNNAGTTASFSVNAAATSQLYYQWYFGTNILADQTNSTLNIASVGPTNVGYYQVTVSSAGGSTNGSPVTLTVIYQSPNIVGGQMMLGADGFQLTFAGPSGQTYEVLASDDVTVAQSAWTVVDAGTFSGPNVNFTDPDAVGHPHRFYVIKSP